MASTTTDDRDKHVTGYPSHPDHIVTGYPQLVPAPAVFHNAAAPYYHHHHHQHDDGPYRRPQCSSFIYRMMAAVFIVFLVMGIVFFVIWLVVRPRLPEFIVASVAVSPLNTTATDLSASWDISFVVTNPNHKLTVFYDRLETSIVYGEDFLLSETQLPPFFQTKHNQTLFHARLAVVGANVGEEVAMEIRSDLSHGSVSFNFRVFALVKFRSGAWRTRRHLLRVYCEGVNIGYSSSNGPGTLSNPSKECEVTL